MTFHCAILSFAACTLVLAAGIAHAEPRRVSWSSVGDDAEALLEAPFHMERDNALRTAAGGVVIGASMLWLDARIDRTVRENPDEFPWAAARSLSGLAGWYGKNGRNALIAAAGIVGVTAAGGYLADDDRVVDTAAIMGESVVFSMALFGVTKMVLGRKRPHDNAGPHAFEWFVGPLRREALSFPSGHAATAFALAGAGAGRHPHWYVQVPAYTLAVSAALQRMDVRAHWLSDVIAGGLLGYAVSEYLVDRYDGDAPASAGSARLSVVLRVRF